VRGINMGIRRIIRINLIEKLPPKYKLFIERLYLYYYYGDNYIGKEVKIIDRWISRLWPETYWTELARILVDKGYETILLGGTQEDNKNRRIAELTRAKYFGVTSLKKYFSLMNQCDIVVSQVTMAMHVAIALKKYLVLMNNIFNRKEFYLYSRGIIIEPGIDCLGCFKQNFDNNCKSSNCMELISVPSILAAIESRN
jgi:heptosyltransferase-2